MAGAFQLSDFDGQSPTGNWTLRVNQAATDSWRLDRWKVRICAQ
jgi:subtilisin-like proprotein convertase family protein